MGEQCLEESKSNFLLAIEYLININEIINEDIDETYLLLLERAIEYGMSAKEFWKNDIEEYYCYENAYQRRLHSNAHVQGLYNYIALSTIASNLLRKSNSEQKHYPEKNLLEDYEQKQRDIITQNKKGNKYVKNVVKEHLEDQYRIRLQQCY